MREILFRGKQVDDGKWLYGDLIQSVDKSEVAIIEEKDCFVCNAETVGQFTGLTDKNDKKIFEGDIVKDKFGRTMQIKYNNNRYRLMFYLVNFELNWTDNFICADFDGWAKSSIEVIGNIYDNPELLRKTKQFGNSEQLKNKEKEVYNCRNCVALKTQRQAKCVKSGPEQVGMVI